MSRKKATNAKRSAPKRAAGKSASRSRATVKRAARATRKKAAQKRTAAVRTTNRGAARTRTTAKGKVSKKTARPRLRLVTTPAALSGKPLRTTRRVAPKLKAVAGGAAAAEAVREAVLDPASKQHVLFNLMRTRAHVLSVLHNLTAADAERPIARGKWCVREIVAHLALRDRARLRELETTLRGGPSSWSEFTLSDWKRSNAFEMKKVAHLNWAAVLDLLRTTRDELIEALESVPEEPAEVWGESHTFGAMLSGLPPHDLHHGDQIERWREKQGL